MYIHPKTQKIKVSVGEFSNLPWFDFNSVTSPTFSLVEDDVGFAHETIQLQRKEKFSHYLTEEYLTYSLEREGWTIEISGRIDGIVKSTEQELIIEEIKTTSDVEGLLEALDEPTEHPYGLQLMTYGMIYKLSNPVVPQMRMVVASIELDGEIHEVTVDTSWGVIEDFFESRIDYIFDQAKNYQENFYRRQEQNDHLQFPYADLRKNQSDLCEFLQQSLKKTSSILFQAPTGLGKTVSVLFSGLHHSLQRGAQLIYATPKNSQQELVLSTCEIWAEKLPIYSLQYSAREKICRESIGCEDQCPLRTRFLDKQKDSNYSYELFKSQRTWTRERVLDAAKKEGHCPYLLQQEFIKYADVVALDYNHIIAPVNSMEKILYGEPSGKRKPVLVVDEAHNLIQRSWDEYSPFLRIQSALNLIQALRLSDSSYPQVSMVLKDFVEWWKSQQSQKELSQSLREVMLLELLDLKQSFNSAVRSELEVNSDPMVASSFEEFYFELIEFLRILTSSIESFAVSKSDSELKLICYDAREVLGQVFSEFYNKLFFSATLKPFEHYSRCFGVDGSEIHTYEFQSPFEDSQRKIICIPQVSTKRSKMSKSVPKVAEIIQRISSVKKANYLAFFPSYSYLKTVSEVLDWPEDKVLVQRPNMSAEQISKIFEKLKKTKGCILLGVQGGVLSEGIDFLGEMAEGVFVVGPGLPAYSQENLWRRDFFEEKFGDGERAIFQIPGLGRSIQAAGRVIRSETDRGLIVLIDDRFLADDYQLIYPKDWFASSLNEHVSKSILKDVSGFWEASQ